MVGLVRVMQFSREEELVANGLKIIRYSIKDEQNHAKTVLDYPDMINDVIMGVPGVAHVAIWTVVEMWLSLHTGL